MQEELALARLEASPTVASILMHAKAETTILATAMEAKPKYTKMQLADFVERMATAADAVAVDDRELQPVYMFPGVQDVLVFDSLKEAFETTLNRIGTRSYDCADSRCVFNVNGGGLGLPFHRHTSVLHGVVAGAKRFFFYGHGVLPPFGADVPEEPERLVKRWALDELPHLPATSRPTFECTVGSGDAIFVPWNMTHATLNLVDTISLVRSGCNGAIPGIRKEVLNPQCPGPEPEHGGPWKASDFVLAG